jgi:hypothetical protein
MWFIWSESMLSYYTNVHLCVHKILLNHFHPDCVPLRLYFKIILSSVNGSDECCHLASDAMSEHWERHNYLHTNLLTLLTPCSRVHLEKLTSFQPVKKFLAFYGTQRFITAFTSARHLSPSWASSIQSIPSHPISWRPFLILSSHLCLGLPISLFHSGFPTKSCIGLSSNP